MRFIPSDSPFTQSLELPLCAALERLLLLFTYCCIWQKAHLASGLAGTFLKPYFPRDIMYSSGREKNGQTDTVP
jgi:hypothetical protein